jgi:hypothetical protein
MPSLYAACAEAHSSVVAQSRATWTSSSGRALSAVRLRTRRALVQAASLSQEVGLALGAQAGEARIRDVVTSGGFTRFRRAAETPFNLVFEARP